MDECGQRTELSLKKMCFPFNNGANPCRLHNDLKFRRWRPN
jgi:hypothetical protein